MFGGGMVRSAARRVGLGALVAFCLTLLVSDGGARALCLDGGGECSPAAATAAGPCHDRPQDSGATSACSSCVDVLVPEAAAAASSRADLDRPLPAVGSAPPGLFRAAAAAPAPGPAGSRGPAREPFPRVAVLRI